MTNAPIVAIIAKITINAKPPTKIDVAISAILFQIFPFYSPS